MLRILLVLLYLQFSCTTFAQKIRFTDTTNVWQVHQWFPAHSFGNVMYRYYYEGTVVYNGYRYSILRCKDLSTNQYQGTQYIREDTITNTIYIRSPLTSPEYRVFDFNAKIGDTVTKYNIVGPIVVTAIDSIMINNYWHKRFTIEEYGYYYGQFIEAIGVINDYVPPRYSNAFYTAHIICFSNHGIPVITVPQLFLDNCRDILLNVPETINTNQLRIYPQPATSEVQITLPNNASSGNFILSDLAGQVIYRADYHDKKELKFLNNNWHGIYLYRLSTAASSFSGKIVFE